MSKRKGNEYSYELASIMKRMNFVEDVGYYTRRFTRIYEEGDSFYIGHSINKSKTKIELKDIEWWINHFDKL
jgi:hypothetical protein